MLTANTTQSIDWKEQAAKQAASFPLPAQFMTALHGFGVELLAEHFVQHCQQHPTLIEFTPSADYGSKGRTTISKVGKYLQKYYQLDNEAIKELVSVWKACTDKPFQVASDRASIRRVYEYGPNSCMSGSVSIFNCGGIHPAEVYAGPDTAVAYLEKERKITARAVIVPKEKLFIRVYGDDALEKALGNAGYTRGSLEGARLLAIEVGKEQWAMTYLDGEASSVDLSECGEYFIVEEYADYDTASVSSTRGVLGENPYTCSCCGGSINEDEVYYPEHDDLIGNCCIDDGTYVWAYVNNDDRELVHHTSVVYEYEGKHYTQAGLEHHSLILLDNEVYNIDDVVFSEFEDEYIPSEDAVGYTTVDGEQDYMRESDADTYLVEDYSGEKYLEDDAVGWIDADGDQRYSYDEDDVVVDALSGDIIGKEDANTYLDLLGDTQYTYAELTE